MSAFTYCLNTSTIRPTPLLKKIELAGKAGYRAIEPWNDEVDDYLASGGTLAELKQALADAGLKVVSMIALHGWITSEGAEHARVLDDCKRRMAQAAQLESPFIVASPPQEVVDLEHAGKRFAELLAIGTAQGVIPSM
jgi:2-keto-myo-inositol isomerase